MEPVYQNFDAFWQEEANKVCEDGNSLLVWRGKKEDVRGMIFREIALAAWNAANRATADFLGSEPVEEANQQVEEPAAV